MVFLHHDLSVVEVIALVEAGLIALAIVVGILANLGPLFRYFRLRNM